MRSRVVVVLLGLLAIAVPARSAATGPTARIVDGRVADWRGQSTRLGGTWQYSSGEFVYQDHIYDDLGADTRQRSEQHGNTGAPSGDLRYPSDEARYGNNAADLLELRLAADARDLWVLARMNTLKTRDATVVAIGLDTDGKRSTGGGAWPYGAGISAAGVDKVITLWGTAGAVTRLDDGARASVRDVAVDTGNDNNAIEARIPRSMIGGTRLRVWAASGLWNGAEWLAAAPGAPSEATPGGGSPLVAARPFNVAFRADETGSYMEELQGAALASGDITPFSADVDLNALSAGRDRAFRIKPGRFYAAIVDERTTIPPHHEGVSYDGVPGRFAGIGGAALSQTFNFYGRHQPYGLYVPSTYDGRRRLPASLALHGHGGSHSTYNSQPGFIADMGEGTGSRDQPPMFLITPLARGSSFYADWGEADTLAVLRDVFTRFRIDRERLYLTGYSMGGYGVYRLASLYPDLFAAAGVWAGYTGEFTGAYLTSPQSLVDDPTGQAGAISEAVRALIAPAGIGGGRQGKANIGDPVDTLENLRHLPLVHLAGTNDEIVPTPGQFAGPRRLAELGYRSRFDLYPGYEHLTFAIVDDWKQVRAWLGNTRRESAPRDIDYVFSDGWTAPGLAHKLGLRHGNAWWLRDLTMRKTTDDALGLVSASATSRAIPARSPVAVDTVGPANAPTPHLQRLVAWEPGRTAAVENRLDLRLSGVGSAAIRMEQARLRPCGLVLSLSTDGPTTVRLQGRFPKGARLTGLKGVRSHIDARSGALVASIPRPATGSAAVACHR